MQWEVSVQKIFNKTKNGFKKSLKNRHLNSLFTDRFLHTLRTLKLKPNVKRIRFINYNLK